MFCLSKAVQEHNSGNSNKREPRIVHENLTPAVDKKAWSRCIFAQQPNRSKQHSHIQQQSWPTGPPKPKKTETKISPETKINRAGPQGRPKNTTTELARHQIQNKSKTKNTRDKKHQRQKITRDEKQKQEKTQQSMKGRNRWLWVKTPYPWFPHH